MITFEVEPVSYANLKKDLKRYGEQAKDAIMRAVWRTALAIETTAKKKLTSDKHIVTGRLRASIHSQSKSENSFNGVTASKGEDKVIEEPVDNLEAITGTNVVYGPRIEVEQDSYLRYAADMEEKKFEGRVEDELNKLT